MFTTFDHTVTYHQVCYGQTSSLSNKLRLSDSQTRLALLLTKALAALSLNRVQFDQLISEVGQIKELKLLNGLLSDLLKTCVGGAAIELLIMLANPYSLPLRSVHLIRSNVFPPNLLFRPNSEIEIENTHRCIYIGRVEWATGTEVTIQATSADMTVFTI